MGTVLAHHRRNGSCEAPGARGADHANGPIAMNMQATSHSMQAIASAAAISATTTWPLRPMHSASIAC